MNITLWMDKYIPGTKELHEGVTENIQTIRIVAIMPPRAQDTEYNAIYVGDSDGKLHCVSIDECSIVIGASEFRDEQLHELE